MNDPDPTQAASLGDLAECLRQLHIRADRPSLRELEDRTKHVNGLLPGTSLKRVRLGRTTLNDVLRGFKFPRKAFLLTFVEALNIDLNADRRWEQAWDHLAIQYLDEAAEAEEEQLRRQLAEARAQADRADEEAEQLRQQLADAEDLSRQQTMAAEEMATHLETAQAETRKAHDRLIEATAAHAVELKQTRADAQARIEAAQASAGEAIRQAQADADAAVRAAEIRIAQTEQQARELADRAAGSGTTQPGRTGGQHRRRHQAREQAKQDHQAAQDVGLRADRDITAYQDTRVSGDGPASHDALEDQDASAVPDLEREVTVVPAVPRYHSERCILIRFMGKDDVETTTLAAAWQRGYTPCRACLADDSGPSVG